VRNRTYERGRSCRAQDDADAGQDSAEYVAALSNANMPAVSSPTPFRFYVGLRHIVHVPCRVGRLTMLLSRISCACHSTAYLHVSLCSVLSLSIDQIFPHSFSTGILNGTHGKENAYCHCVIGELTSNQRKSEACVKVHAFLLAYGLNFGLNERTCGVFTCEQDITLTLCLRNDNTTTKAINALKLFNGAIDAIHFKLELLVQALNVSVVDF
jgi:hypothetical protein